MNKTNFTTDKNKLHVTRTFDAPLELVWRAWTEAELLDLWWAPKPWKSETKSMDFKEGGSRLYAMIGPAGEEHWGRTDYKTIVFHNHFIGVDVFCDKQGNTNTELPGANFQSQFLEKAGQTLVTMVTEYTSEQQLQQIMEMGMKEGLSMAFENLDEYIKQQFALRNAMKTDNAARVTTYLNFPGNTEVALNFYKSVFKTEFIGKGIQRFSDIKPEAGNPPILDSVKNMVLHAELPLLGGHVLMATDAPAEMGFTMEYGNNMHICLEPASREETQRLFDALSKGGKVIMPMADMFFGAFFGQCTDQFGINWMFNFKLQDQKGG